MSIKTFLLLLFLSLETICNCKNNLLIEKILKSSDQTTLQQTANILMLFVSEQPRVADKIISEDATCDVSKEKTAALDAIQNTCNSNLTTNRLQSEPLHKIEFYENSLNKLYLRLYSKLDKKHKKILFGNNKGSTLPQNIHFFFREKKEMNTTTNVSLLQLFYSIFC